MEIFIKQNDLHAVQKGGAAASAVCSESLFAQVRGLERLSRPRQLCQVLVYYQTTVAL